MPGMKLDFLKNPAQRVASGKSLPLKQVEAVILYGRPEQKANVIKKLLPSAYALSLNKSTHHILLTILDHTDNLTRVQFLYHVRRKILDMSTSPAGNVVLQHLLEKVPSRQRKEIAETFVLNAEEGEFKRLCEHAFGNHVAQKLLEYPECAEVVFPVFVPHLAQLSLHCFGMRVVAKYVDTADGGWRSVLQALIPQISWKEDDVLEQAQALLRGDTSSAVDKGLQRLFEGEVEPLVVAALLRHLLVPAAVKDAICAHLCEYAEDYLCLAPAQSGNSLCAEADDTFGLPDFGPKTGLRKLVTPGKDHAPAPRHTHLYNAMFEHGDAAQRAELWEALCKPAPRHSLPKGGGGEEDAKAEGDSGSEKLFVSIISRRETVLVAVAAFKYADASRAEICRALFTAPGEASRMFSITAVAQDPVRSILLRAIVEVDPERIGTAQRQELFQGSLELSKDPISSPVLQRFVEVDTSNSEAVNLIHNALQEHWRELICHPAASYLVQALLQNAPESQRDNIIQNGLIPAFGDDLREPLSHQQGSRVMQKLLAYASDEAVIRIIDCLIHKADEADGASAHVNEGADEDEATSPVDDENARAKPTKLSSKAQRAVNRSKHYDVLSHAIRSYALHQHACYVVQSLLRETRSRQLDRERKWLMNELKPYVFDLAVSPWAGRVVLDTMLQTGSAQLAAAMKNVVFLKAEAWLSEISEEGKKKGAGMSPTIRSLLKRQRTDEEAENGNDGARKDDSVGITKKPRKFYRMLKK